MLRHRTGRVGAVLAVAGSLLLLTGTYLHPVPPDPNNAVAAFAEYSADPSWVAVHLIQLGGFAFIMAAFVVIAEQLEDTDDHFRSLAKGGAISSLAVATVLQAVDGIALKRVLDLWVKAGAMEKPQAFYAAMAVRQVEIGLDSTLSILFGGTVVTFGILMVASRVYPRWMGIFAIVGAVPAMVAGVAMAFMGYSNFAMDTSMASSATLLLWMTLLGVVMWRQR